MQVCWNLSHRGGCVWMLSQWLRRMNYGLSNANHRALILHLIKNGKTIWNGVIDIFGQLIQTLIWTCCHQTRALSYRMAMARKLSVPRRCIRWPQPDEKP